MAAFYATGKSDVAQQLAEEKKIDIALGGGRAETFYRKPKAAAAPTGAT